MRTCSGVEIGVVLGESRVRRRSRNVLDSRVERSNGVAGGHGGDLSRVCSNSEKN